MDPYKWDSFDSFDVLTQNEPANTETQPKDAAKSDTKDKTFRVRDFIPKRKNRTNLFIGLLVGFIVMIITISVIATIVPGTSEEEESAIIEGYEKLTSSEPVQLILSDGKKFTSYNALNNKTSLFHQFNYTVSAFDIYDDMIFWSETNTSRIMFALKDSSQSNTTFKNSSLLLEEARLDAKKMAFDHIGRNLYILDESKRTLCVINVLTKKHDIILTDIFKPHQIDLDPDQGLMFISQQSDSIFRGNMDGTVLTKIISNRGVSAITLDRSAKKVYWVNDHVGIESSDYNGENIDTFPTDAINIVDLAVINHQLYWLWLQDYDVSATHHLISCRIDKGICKEQSMREVDYFENLGSIRVAHASLNLTSNKTSRVNKCKINNGGCQHLCLVTPNGERSCTCNLGWQLNPDRKSCREVKEFMLYTLDLFFRARVLDIWRNVSIDVIWPTPYHTESTTSDITFDYDKRNDVVYFSNPRSVYSMRLRSNWTSQTLILHKDELTVTNPMLDDRTGNLYYVQRERFGLSYSIRVFNTKLGVDFNRTYSNNLCDTRISMVCRPFSLAMHPDTGNLFYVVSKNYGQKFVYRTNINDSELVRVTGSSLFSSEDYNFIGIDEAEKRIYWIYEKGFLTVRLMSSDFHGSNIKNFTVSNMGYPTGLSVHRRWIYVSTHFSVFRFDKENGYSPYKMTQSWDPSSRRISGLKVVSDIARSSGNEANPCDSKDNGGCEQFCFVSDSKAVCKCRDGEEIGDNGHCKKEEPNTTVKDDWRIGFNISHLLANKTSDWHRHWPSSFS